CCTWVVSLEKNTKLPSLDAQWRTPYRDLQSHGIALDSEAPATDVYMDTRQQLTHIVHVESDEQGSIRIGNVHTVDRDPHKSPQPMMLERGRPAVPTLVAKTRVVNSVVLDCPLRTLVRCVRE